MVHGVSHPRAFPKCLTVLKTNTFSKSMLISSSTEICKLESVFQNFQWQCFHSHMWQDSRHTHTETHTHTHTKTRREKEGNMRWGTIVRDHVWDMHMHLPQISKALTISDHMVGCHSNVLDDVLCSNPELPASFTDSTHRRSCTHSCRERERCCQE